jgi:hypothetical protein
MEPKMQVINDGVLPQRPTHWWLRAVRPTCSWGVHPMSIAASNCTHSSVWDMSGVHHMLGVGG